MAKRIPKRQAVALKYNARSDNAPIVTAKGTERLAEMIIDLAKRNNIPIKEDKNLVQILSLLDLNQEIPPMVYAAVAEILTYVHRLSKSPSSQAAANHRS